MNLARHRRIDLDGRGSRRIVRRPCQGDLPAGLPTKLVDEEHIVFEIRHDDRSLLHRIAEGLGDFRFSATGNRAWFMAEGSLGGGPDQSPALPLGRLSHFHLVTGWHDIGGFGLQRYRRFAFVVPPAHFLIVQVDVDAFR